MLTIGVIKLSKSPNASAVVLVNKKWGDWRFCIDYRPLNKVTIRDEDPLGRINDVLRSIKESRYFIALDSEGRILPKTDGAERHSQEGF